MFKFILAPKPPPKVITAPVVNENKVLELVISLIVNTSPCSANSYFERTRTEPNEPVEVAEPLIILLPICNCCVPAANKFNLSVVWS